MEKRYRWRSVLSRWVVCLLTVNVIAASAGVRRTAAERQGISGPGGIDL